MRIYKLINVPDFKGKKDNYYEYGNQKYAKSTEANNYVKTSFVAAFGLACLAVGVFMNKRRI